MKNIYLNIYRPNLHNLKKAKKFIENNNIIGLPTETVYGLAGNAYSSVAVKKIFSLKKRPMHNPLIVHYHDLSTLKNDCVLNKNFFLLYKKFCPGPLTFVLKLKKKTKISKFVNNKKKIVAVRFPKHPIIKSLLKKLKYPLAAPSANISTKLSAVKALDVQEEFGNKVKFILDGGRCNIGLESTIINLVGKPKILRLGGLEVSKIRKIIKEEITININPSKKNAPGQSKLHYSPGIPLEMNKKYAKKNQALICLGKKFKSSKNHFNLSKSGNLKEAANNLYKTMREIKKRNFKSIAVVKIPNKKIGYAINDRLMKASNK